MAVDFQKSKSKAQSPLLPGSIGGVDVEAYKYLGVHMDEKLDCSVNSDTVYRKTQSQLFFLRRLWSFNVCSKMLKMFYQSVVVSVLF